jgi:hypothetical protein
VSSRLPAVPRTAASVFGPQPWASGIVISITASEPTIATASGDFPSRIEGTTKNSTSRRLRPRPTSDIAPRRRAKRSTTATKMRARTIIGLPRSKS